MKSRRRELISDEDQEPLLFEMTTKDDPYFSMRDYLTSQMEAIKEKHDRFQELLRTVDTTSNQEFKEIRKSLRNDVRSFDKHLKSLFEAIDYVDKNRGKFLHIKDSEVNGRKKFAEGAQSSINAIKAGMDSSAVRKKIEDDERKVKNKAFDESMNNMYNRVSEENENFIQDNRKVTKELVKQQDVNIGHLGEAVGRLEERGRAINAEIKEQTIMLDNLGNEIDVASEKMNTVQAALSKLLKTNDKCQIWSIVVLALVLIILVACVIWT